MTKTEGGSNNNSNSNSNNSVIASKLAAPLPLPPSATTSTTNGETALTQLLSSALDAESAKTKEDGSEGTKTEVVERRKQNHREVERRRRDIINAGILELGKIVPDCEKNKGSILHKTVEYIKYLQGSHLVALSSWQNGKKDENERIRQLAEALEQMKHERDLLQAQLNLYTGATTLATAAAAVAAATASASASSSSSSTTTGTTLAAVPSTTKTTTGTTAASTTAAAPRKSNNDAGTGNAHTMPLSSSSSSELDSATQTLTAPPVTHALLSIESSSLAYPPLEEASSAEEKPRVKRARNK